ncbi:type VI secretion system spike protein VgrG1b-like isoform X3 [Triplophysa dalaica]|uniref:type VI secretion system spike protein VgrG1b-like isoform X3 n=1 Tax=Triplophysa dalaica TaxID=1582913 RepID=UPI0024DF7563|nr:type VI secretion system spike protein VgrG1b-like isoform X3 [Triplophysa dalaica]
MFIESRGNHWSSEHHFEHKMSGKRQLSILSFTLRGKPTKKSRLQDAGPEKVAKMVGTLGEETEEETVQVEDDETVQVEDDETVQVEDDETVQVEDDETVQVEDDETVQVEDEETVQVEEEETVVEMAKVSEEAI